jgi:hypothetical protein
MTELRAITVKQPWAAVIAQGVKTIENRSLHTHHRGPLAIHAGAAWSDRGMRDPRIRAAWRRAGLPTVPGTDQGRWCDFPDRLAVPHGAVIAVCEVVDCHPDGGCCRPWGESDYVEAAGRRRTGLWHWLLDDIRPLPVPVPWRGALGLWRLPAGWDR